MANNIERLKQILKKIGHGEIRIKIENGEPVSIPPQVVEKSFGEINNVTIIDKAIDLTKEQ